MWQIAVIMLCVGVLLKYYFLTAPFVPVRAHDLPRLRDVVARTGGSRFCDLGCGNGRTLASLVTAFPEKEFHGIEIGPLLWLWSAIRFRTKPNVRVQWGSFFWYPWAPYDVLFVFWIPKTIAKMEKQITQKIRPGQTVISYAFPVEFLAGSLVETSHESGRLPFYVYRVQ